MDTYPEKPNARNIAKYRALMKLKAEHPIEYQQLYLVELTPLFHDIERSYCDED